MLGFDPLSSCKHLRMQKKWIFNFLLIIASNAVIWTILLMYSNDLVIAGLLFMLSIWTCITFFRQSRIVGALFSIANPFILTITASICMGCFTTISGRAELAFVTNDLETNPYNERDLAILKRRSIVPEHGILDYMATVPNNATVRLMMSFEGKVDQPFKLVYDDELPQGMNMEQLPE